MQFSSRPLNKRLMRACINAYLFRLFLRILKRIDEHHDYKKILGKRQKLQNIKPLHNKKKKEKEGKR